MSCHNIGRGMNSVVKVVIGLYDNNGISKESAKEIIAACRKGVHWCDGNENEATAIIRRCRCGNCLKKIPKGEPLYSVYDLPYGFPDKYKIENKYGLASDGLCDDCFSIIINNHLNKNDIANEYKQTIIDAGDDYISEGE